MAGDFLNQKPDSYEKPDTPEFSCIIHENSPDTCTIEMTHVKRSVIWLFNWITQLSIAISIHAVYSSCPSAFRQLLIIAPVASCRLNSYQSSRRPRSRPQLCKLYLSFCQPTILEQTWNELAPRTNWSRTRKMRHKISARQAKEELQRTSEGGMY